MPTNDGDYDVGYDEGFEVGKEELQPRIEKLKKELEDAVGDRDRAQEELEDVQDKLTELGAAVERAWDLV